MRAALEGWWEFVGVGVERQVGFVVGSFFLAFFLVVHVYIAVFSCTAFPLGFGLWERVE